jgi:hypothetical protein
LKKGGLDISFKDISENEAKEYVKSLGTVDPSEMGVLMEMYQLCKMGKLNMATKTFEEMCGRKVRGCDECCTDMAKLIKSGKTGTELIKAMM